MIEVNIHEAKTHLSRLVERAAAGEEIVIAKAGKPMARLVAYREKAQPRQAGSLKGQIWMSDDWDSDAVNEEIAELFEENAG
jgi:prevent-host-death family protein